MLSCLDPPLAYVCKVNRDDVPYVLKVVHRTKSSLEAQDLLVNEQRVLARVPGLSGITQLENVYPEINGYYGILKQYSSGKLLHEVTSLPSLTNIEKQLETTVRDIHSAGLMRLDIHGLNIAISDNLAEAN